MSVPVALRHFQWICCNLANRSSTTDGNSISRYMSNKMVLSGLIDANDGRSEQVGSVGDLDTSSILAGAKKSSCLTHIITMLVSVYLKKIIVRVSVLYLSHKIVNRATSESGGNGDLSRGDHD